MNKIEYELSAMAVGMSISFLSMILNSTKNFHITVDNQNHSLIILKKIFGISDNKLFISVKNKLENNMFWEFSDMGKLTSPYISIEGFFVDSKFVKLSNKKNKPCIALASYQDFDHLKNFDSTDVHWPNSRYRSVEEYSKIYSLIKSAGFEVITLDNNTISLEDKLYWLNEYCEAVIGYEGGLCHIAHVLKIPSIIIPVRPYESFLTTHSLHMDSRTYFPKTFEEILKWKENDLLEILYLLKNNKGNNIFLGSQVHFAKNFTEYKIKTTEREYSILNGIRKYEIDFFSNYITNHTIFGNDINFDDSLGINLDQIPCL